MVSSPSGKKYIGITAVGLSDRKSKHLYSSTHDCKTSTFSKAIRKYGIDGLNWKIVLKGMTQQEAKYAEILYIQLYNTFKKGYNSTRGGEGAWGYVWDKAKFSVHHEKRRKKYYNDPEWCKAKGEITKKWINENPEKHKDHLELMIRRSKETRPEWREKWLKSVTSREAKIKGALSIGCEEFNVYNYKTKQYVGTWLLRSECCRELGLSNGKISSCLKGSRNRHKEYIFKLVSDPSVEGTEFNDKWLEELKPKKRGNYGKPRDN